MKAVGEERVEHPLDDDQRSRTFQCKYLELVDDRLPQYRPLLAREIARAR